MCVCVHFDMAPPLCTLDQIACTSKNQCSTPPPPPPPPIVSSPPHCIHCMDRIESTRKQLSSFNGLYQIRTHAQGDPHFSPGQKFPKPIIKAPTESGLANVAPHCTKPTWPPHCTKLTCPPLYQANMPPHCTKRT